MAIQRLFCGLAAPLLSTLLVVVAPAAQSRADETEIPAASIASERSCFEGKFATLSDYLQSLPNKLAIADAQARYQYWTSQFDCRLFTYEVDGLEVHGFYSKPKTDPGRRLPVVIYNHGAYTFVRPATLRTYDLTAQLTSTSDEYPQLGHAITLPQSLGVEMTTPPYRGDVAVKMTITPDGRTAFIAGSERVLVQPVP